MSEWVRLMQIGQEFTIDQACRLAGVEYRNAQKLVRQLCLAGRLEVVRTEPRRYGNLANVYRVVPPLERQSRRAGREQMGRRARSVL